MGLNSSAGCWLSPFLAATPHANGAPTVLGLLSHPQKTIKLSRFPPQLVKTDKFKTSPIQILIVQVKSSLYKGKPKLSAATFFGPELSTAFNNLPDSVGFSEFAQLFF